MFIQRKRNGRRIMASEGEAMGEVFVEPEASDLLFETEDVADILAEATGEDVTVEADPETEAVTFDVGGEQFEVTPEGNEEILESRKACASRRTLGKRVAASNRLRRGRGTVAASRRRVAASRSSVRPSARVRASRRLGRRTYR